LLGCGGERTTIGIIEIHMDTKPMMQQRAPQIINECPGGIEPQGSSTSKLSSAFLIDAACTERVRHKPAAPAFTWETLPICAIHSHLGTHSLSLRLSYSDSFRAEALEIRTSLNQVNSSAST
jgi:hypothetical protein